MLRLVHQHEIGGAADLDQAAIELAHPRGVAGRKAERQLGGQLAEVQAIADNPAAPSFDNTILALEKSGRLLSRATTLLFNLIGADVNPARQQLQTDYAPKLSAQRDAVLLNPKLFARVEALYAARDKAAPNALVISRETLAPLDAKERETLMALLGKLR